MSKVVSLSKYKEKKTKDIKKNGTLIVDHKTGTITAYQDPEFRPALQVIWDKFIAAMKSITDNPKAKQ